MIAIIIFGVLLILFLYAVLAHATTRMSFIEKEPQIIDFTEVRDDSEHPDSITGYRPIVKFEVDGKMYQGVAHVFPLWRTREVKPLIILYNPKDPSEFKVKESSTSPVTGCVFVFVLIVVLIVSIYIYLHG